MVKHHDVLVQGVDVQGTPQPAPVLLRMNDTDFPAHFLKALAAPGQNLFPSIQTVESSEATPATLYQPVQRIVHLAMVELNCNTLGTPPLATTRIESAVLVVRRVYRKPGQDGKRATDEFHSPHWAWMRTPQGTFDWVRLAAGQGKLDPDPTKRPQLQSGRADLDQLLSAMSLASANTEVFTPAFVASPDICSALGRTIVYGLIPTASSEVGDTQPSPPTYDPQNLSDNLPLFLKSGTLNAPFCNQAVTAQWLSEDYLLSLQLAAGDIAQFQQFTTTLRMLYSVFGAFDEMVDGNLVAASAEGQKILQLLDRHIVTVMVSNGNTPISVAQPMGEFYQTAANALLGLDGSNGGSIHMPSAWEPLSAQDESDLLVALIAALTPQTAKVLAPQGRFQDSSRYYTVRLFLRIKPETPACPTQLICSAPSAPFRIAAWYESAGRPLPPVPLPDPTNLRALAKPNASFHVPANLMKAMQGTSLSGMLKGSGGGGPNITIDWICGFSIPLITICAFFVLNIFFSLLAIIFFWLPFFKICIPIPVPSPSDGDK
ncbi:MAG: hypothetical protein WCC87_04600 [Candidatus Korobacteraceae bacterium]